MKYTYETTENSSYVVATFSEVEKIDNGQLQILLDNDLKNIIKPGFEVVDKAVENKKPNFFTLGYYKMHNPQKNNKERKLRKLVMRGSVSRLILFCCITRMIYQGVSNALIIMVSKKISSKVALKPLILKLASINKNTPCSDNTRR